MAEIIIAKTKLRRGTDAQRQLVVFDQGEPVFTTDTKRLFIGSGTTFGGNVIGSKVHPPLVLFSSLTATNAQVGDLVYVNNKFYELIAEPYTDVNNWLDVNLKANPSVFSYDSSNVLQLNLSGLSAFYIDPNTLGYALHIVDNKLSVNWDPVFFSIDGNNALTLNNDSITEFQINSSTLSSGLTGGSGSKIQVDIDPAAHLKFNGNQLAVDISGIAGSGLEYDSGSDTITLSDLNISPLSAPLVAINVDTFGRVSNLQTSMYDLIEIDTNGLPENVFNGAANTNFDPLTSIINTLTVFSGTLVSNGLSVVSLSSAGMIALEGGFPVRGDTGMVMKRFAIPVFVF